VTTPLTVLNNSAIAPRWKDIRDAAWTAWKAYRDGDVAYDRPHRRLLTPPGANAKLAKGLVPIYGLTLAPAGASGYQLCPWRSPECEAACLGITSGRSRFSNVQEARIRKTRILMETPAAFFRQLYDELAAARRKHGNDGLKFAFRSNVLSDIPWEYVAPQIYQFSAHNYDYTKSFDRAVRSLNPDWEGADLTLSFSGHNWYECETFMQMGGNAAVVFAEPKDHPLPESYRGFHVIDGDQSDLRIMDTPGCIVGLRAKGKINLASPFVVRV
jgi:hypothetical protein